MAGGPLRFRFLTLEDVVAAGGDDLPATLASCEEALRMWSMGTAKESSASAMRWNKEGNWYAVSHAGYIGPPHDVAGVKWVTSNPANQDALEIPRSLAQIILTDYRTGIPLAIMDGTVISAARCAAVAALGVKYLSHARAAVCAAIGCGAIQRAHLRALREVAHLTEVRLFDVRRDRAESLAQFVREHLKLDSVVVGSAREAVTNADIVSCATVVGPDEAYLEGDWLAEGAVVVNISAHDPKESAVVLVDRVVVTSYAHLLSRGACARAHSRGSLNRDKVCEIGEIIAGRGCGRSRDTERILYDSGGMGINDVINAHRVYRNAEKIGAGTHLDLWQRPPWL